MVLDTNVFVAAYLARNPRSPNREVIQRWLKGEFVLLTASEIILEIVDKLLEKKVDQQKILRLITNLLFLAESIELHAKDIEPIVLDDPDDDIIFACALKGKAKYLVTYDPHLLSLGTIYKGIYITESLVFLMQIRIAQKE